MNHKLLVICGSTATGKTSLGITLARKLNGEIISADSRQVYKGMDIGTGKEWPPAHRASGPEGKDVVIWGYDIADPKKNFSVAHYVKFADRVISDIQDRGKLPILIGGTGLYIKAVTDGISTISIPRNKNLREKLENKSVDELYDSLSNLDSVKAASLNSSDRKNPRRLIRAIEIIQWRLSHGNESGSGPHGKYSVLFLGLRAPKAVLDQRIESRVKDRIKMGIKLEIRNLLKKGVKWNDQSMMSLGYRQWRDYFEGVVDEKKAIQEWEREEKKYAKRQMTWWNKDARVKWFDVSLPGYPKNVEKLAEKW